MGFIAEDNLAMDLTTTAQDVTFAESEGSYDVFVNNNGAVNIIFDGAGVIVEPGEQAFVGPYHATSPPSLKTASSTSSAVPVIPYRDRDGSCDGPFRKLTVYGGTAAPPELHASTHENGGADEIDVTDLSGLLADAQTPLAHAINAATHTAGTDDTVVGTVSAALAEIGFASAATANALLRRDANGHAIFTIITGTSDPPSAAELAAGNLPAGGIGIAKGTTNAYIVCGEGANTWQVSMTQAA